MNSFATENLVPNCFKEGFNRVHHDNLNSVFPVEIQRLTATFSLFCLFDYKSHMSSKNFVHEIRENFLDIVDEDVLFVDESIDYEFNVKSFPEGTEVAIETEPVALTNGGEVIDLKLPTCFETPPKLLAEQVSLPIEDVQRFCFYETFMISEKWFDSLIPQPDEIEEIGNSCLMVEELSNGNILVFSTQMTFVGCEHFNAESLNVVDKNLKLVHEKRIERSVAGGKLKVVD